MNGLWHIISNTFRENLREPIFLLILVAALVLIGLFPTLALFTFRQQIKLVVDSSMATILVFGWILAVIIAAHSVTREIETGTALLMLAKPVNRPVFILGKILGVILSLLVFCFITTVATLIAVRVAKDQFNLDMVLFGLYFLCIGAGCAAGGIKNFLSNASVSMWSIITMVVLFPLGAVAGNFLAASDTYHWQLVPACVLIAYAVVTLGILATSLSTRLDLVPNLLICACVFFVGTMSDYLFGDAAQTSLIARFLYAIIPNWQLFWMADALAADKAIPWYYVAWGGLYVLFFTALFLALGILLFRNREIGKQNQV